MNARLSSILPGVLLGLVAGATLLATDADARGGARGGGGGARTSINSAGGGGAARSAGASRSAGSGASRSASSGANRTSTGNANRGNANRNTQANRTNIDNSQRNTNIERNTNVNIEGDGGCCHNDWYGDHPLAATAAVTGAVAPTAAAIGSVVYSVPPSCVTTVVNGMTYQQCGSTWYEPQYAGTSVQYVVVNPPQ